MRVFCMRTTSEPGFGRSVVTFEDGQESKARSGQSPQSRSIAPSGEEICCRAKGTIGVAPHC